MMRFICELGSNHMGKLDPIKRAIDQCAHHRLELKLQLFDKDSSYAENNVYLKPRTFELALEYARMNKVEMSASVFGEWELAFLLDLPVSWVKIPYTLKHRKKWIEQIAAHLKEPIVSCDVLTEASYLADVKKLYCIPIYPVPFVADFYGLFPRFDGFSDHTLGFHQTAKACELGARMIEKHCRLGTPEERCADAQFSVLLKDFGEFARNQRQLRGII